MARQRRRHDRSWSVWTFVAPVALVVCAIIVTTVVRNAIDQTRAERADSAAVSTAKATTTAPAKTTPKTPARKVVYTVKEGETLSTIAERYKTTVDAIVKLNPRLNPDAITPGQKIRVS